MEVTESEARDARVILVAFFGQSAANWSINDRVIELIGEMLTKNRKCAEAMDLVPRPGFVDKNYIKRQLRNLAMRIVSGEKSYRICELFIAEGWKSKTYLASLGI